MPDTDWLEKVLSEPTASVDETARALGIGRNSGYESVRRGEIPAVRVGKQYRVPTAWLKKVLHRDAATEAA